MVDVNDMMRAMSLVGEKNAIGAFLKNQEEGAKIVQMTNGFVEPGKPQATVGTSYMEYPQQMVTGFTQLMQQRLGVIENELKALGVTGVANEPAPADRAAARRRR